MSVPLSSGLVVDDFFEGSITNACMVLGSVLLLVIVVVMYCCLDDMVDDGVVAVVCCSELCRWRQIIRSQQDQHHSHCMQ